MVMSFLGLSLIISLKTFQFICAILEQQKIAYILSANLARWSVRYKASKIWNSFRIL